MPGLAEFYSLPATRRSYPWSGPVTLILATWAAPFMEIQRERLASASAWRAMSRSSESVGS